MLTKNNRRVTYVRDSLKGIEDALSLRTNCLRIKMIKEAVLNSVKLASNLICLNVSLESRMKLEPGRGVENTKAGLQIFPTFLLFYSYPNFLL